LEKDKEDEKEDNEVKRKRMIGMGTGMAAQRRAH
jgi:hypothetical protein